MAAINKFLSLPRREEREVKRILEQLEKEKIHVKFEIEGSSARFTSITSQRKGLVVVVKPKGLGDGITRGTWVRMKLPDGRDMRMEVSIPHFNLLSGSYVFLCKRPRSFAESSKRNSERFNTSRFRNLHLVLPDLKTRMRIIDISQTGCKVYSENPRAREVLKIGVPTSHAKIRVGEKVEIDLAAVVPRVHIPNAVGFEFQMEAEGAGSKYLAHFIHSLEAVENKQLQAHAG